MKTALSFSQWKLKPMLQKIFFFLLLSLCASLLINSFPVLHVLSICVAHPSRNLSPFFSALCISLTENSRKDDFIVIGILKT